jgi:LAO/AO transport system kinase
MTEHPENDPKYTALNVNRGIQKPPAVNPYKTKKPERKNYSPSQFTEQIRKGNITVLSQAVTLLESRKQEHLETAREIIEKCLPYAGNSVRIGITGVPGAGKSTSIDAFGMHLIENCNRQLAVLAIDPSSERSNGSILGDKTRMEDLARNSKAFIRPSPAAGSLGGVARKTRETIVLCEAAGFDTIFVETVGVGQSETAVQSMVDFFLLIQLAGTGDELQGIKRGIMEMADGIVVNKADGNNIEKAELAASQYRNALQMFPLPPSGWRPKVLTYSAYKRTGIKEIWEMIDRYITFTKNNSAFTARRNDQAKYWMYETINEQLKTNFYQAPEIIKQLHQKETQVLNSQLSSFAAAKQLLDSYFKNCDNATQHSTSIQ